MGMPSGPNVDMPSEERRKKRRHHRSHEGARRRDHEKDHGSVERFTKRPPVREAWQRDDHDCADDDGLRVSSFETLDEELRGRPALLGDLDELDHASEDRVSGRTNNRETKRAVPVDRTRENFVACAAGRNAARPCPKDDGDCGGSGFERSGRAYKSKARETRRSRRCH